MLSNSASFKTILIESDDFKVGNTTFKSEIQEVDNNVIELDNKINVIDNELDNKITTVNNELNNKITTVNNELDNKITEVDNELNNKITTVDNELNNKITMVDNELNNKITTVDNELNNKITTVDNKVTTVNNELDNKIITVDNKVTTVGNKITTVDNKVTGVDNKLDNEITAVNNKITEITKPNKKYLFTIKDFIKINPSITLINNYYNSVIYDTTTVDGVETIFIKFPQDTVDISNGGIPYLGIIKLDENLIINPNNNIEYYLNMVDKNNIINNNLSDEFVTFYIQSYDDEQNLISSKTLNIFSYKDSLDIFNQKLISKPFLLTEPYTTKKHDVIAVLFSRMRANGSSTGIITVNVKFT